MNTLHSGGMLFWFFLVVVILTFAINLFRKCDSKALHYSALDTLKFRYAKGEISKDEFEEMKKTIK